MDGFDGKEQNPWWELLWGLYPFNPSLAEELSRLFLDNSYGPPVAEPAREEFRRNGLDSEYCPGLEGPPEPLRHGQAPGSGSGCGQRRDQAPPPLPRYQRPPGAFCAFCRNNGETTRCFLGHMLKDPAGRVTCPILRAYTCPICGASGDRAHTIKYCPLYAAAAAAAGGGAEVGGGGGALRRRAYHRGQRR